LIAINSPKTFTPTKDKLSTPQNNSQMTHSFTLELWLTWNRPHLIKLNLKTTLRFNLREEDQTRTWRAFWKTTEKFYPSTSYGKIDHTTEEINITYWTTSSQTTALKLKKSTRPTPVGSHSQCSWRDKNWLRNQLWLIAQACLLELKSTTAHMISYVDNHLTSMEESAKSMTVMTLPRHSMIKYWESNRNQFNLRKQDQLLCIKLCHSTTVTELRRTL